tara:strand:- start:1410 stop:2426 length:1017 start_codon:yes stop_codon:yes gene_type:complete
MSFKLNAEENIFIAGASGMVGSSIKREFEKLGYGEYREKGKLLCPSSKELNLLNNDEVNKWFIKNNPTIVIIAAAKVGGIYANSSQPFDFILENLKIQTNLIENSWKYGVKKLLFLGSSCIYPKFAPQPINENHLLTSSLEKTNEFYAVAKIAGIKLCESLMKQYKFNSICLMPTNLYGPGDNYHLKNSHVIPALIRKFDIAKKQNSENITCWGSGKALREFLYVEDLAKACTFLMHKWNPVENIDSNKENSQANCIINVGSNFEITIKELAEKIAKLFDYQGEIIWDKNMPDGTPKKKLDTSKLEELGWEASTNLDNGLKLTIESYRKEIMNRNIRL